MPIPLIAAAQGVIAANGAIRKLVNNKYLASACVDSALCRSLADTPLTPWYFTPAVYYGRKLYDSISGSPTTTKKIPVVPPSGGGPLRVAKNNTRYAPY